MITEKKYKYIIIDDHPLIRNGIISFLNAYESFEFVGEFDDTRPVLNSRLPQTPDIIILDLNLNGTDGKNYFDPLKKKFPECKIVAFTQYAGLANELSKIGFDGYIIKSEKDTFIEGLLTVAQGKKYFKTNKDFTPPAAQAGHMDDFLKLQQLTKREIEVAKYIMQDFSNREIGEKIFISESTVETHRKHIKEKLKAKNKRELNAILRNLA